MDVKRILWPTDFSENAAKALPWLISIADKYGAETLVLNVIEQPTRMEQLADMLGPDETKRIREAAFKYSQQKLLETCDTYLKECRLFDKRVVMGDVAEEILRVIERERIDMVVMATHGYGGFKRFTFGSVADKIVKNSPVPVLTVKIY